MFDEPSAAKIITQIISAIKYLHKNEVIHMDLKPENILFIKRKDMDIKLIDFHKANSTVGDQPMQLLGAVLPSAKI